MFTLSVQTFALLLPLIGLLAIILKRRSSWSVAIASSLLVPLGGELMLLFLLRFLAATSGAHTSDPALWLRFMMAGVVYFPLAFVAMGPWAAFTAALAWILARNNSIVNRLSFAKVCMVAALAGALGGASFNLLYFIIVAMPEVPARVQDYSFIPYIALSGMFGGLVEGLIVAWFLKEKELPRGSILGNTTAPLAE